MAVSEDQRQKLLAKAAGLNGGSAPAASSTDAGPAQPVAAQQKHNYSIDAVPPFIRDALPMDQVNVSPGDVTDLKGYAAAHPKAASYVDSKSPLSIRVLNQTQFNQGVLNHELSHAVQDRLPAGTTFAPVNPNDVYGYGGTNGLIADAQAKRAVTDYSPEQLARIVETHTNKTADLAARAKAGTLNQEDVDEYRQWKQGAGPVISNFAKLIGNGKTYSSPADTADTIHDLPEMSDQSISIPSNLPHRLAPAPAAAADPTKVVTGMFGTQQPAPAASQQVASVVQPDDLSGDAAPAQKPTAASRKLLDLSAGMRPKDITQHPSGRVTAIDEQTLLPIVRRRNASDATPVVDKSAKVAVAAIEPKGSPNQPSKSDRKDKDGPDKSDRATKCEFGSTQANLSADSDAHKAIVAMQKRVPKEHLVPGRAEEEEADKPHVTLRYGIQSADTAGLRKYLKQQQPFEAKLGKTNIFPPSKNSDGGAVVHAEVESPDLHRMNAEIAKHGDFKESDFPEYKPHVTIGYVKPEFAERYRGMQDAKGKTFTVSHIAISDKDGNHEEVPLGGKDGAMGKTGVGALQLAKGQTVHLASGLKGTIQHVNSSMKIARVRTDKGKNLTVRHSMIAAVEDGDAGNSSKHAAVTA